MAGEKLTGGRPTDYNEEYAEMAYKLCRDEGYSHRKLAKFFGVCSSTVTNWKHEHPEFLAQIVKGKDEHDLGDVEVSLYKQAVGYKHNEKHITEEKCDECGTTKTTIKKVTKFNVVPSATTFYLVNRDPDRWKHKNAIEHSGPGGGAIKTENISATVVGEMTPRDAQDVYNELIRGDKGD